MKTKLEIAKNWLPRYTGTQIDEFGDYMLLTNFHSYIDDFSKKFDCEIKGTSRPMQTATNADGLSIINFGIGSANAATIMDLLAARSPKGVLFLGKCGGLKPSAEIGHFILPTAAIRGEGTSNDYNRRFLLYHLLNFINLFPIKLPIEILNIEQVWFTQQTEEFGNGMKILRRI